MKKKSNSCSEILAHPDLSTGCGSSTYGYGVQKVKMYNNGKCYDELDNYLGIGKIENGVLIIQPPHMDLFELPPDLKEALEK